MPPISQDASPRNGLRCAVIIPTLNEAGSLGEILPGVLAVADEVVVSDGGSTDGTADLAQSLGARVVSGPVGRGIQLNAGVRAVENADILLFLHADTRLPQGALEAVGAAIADGAVGGGFLIRFDHRQGALKLGDWLINLRTRMTNCPLGDQAQFVTREAFQTLEGFRNWPILEDLDFIRRLKRQGRVALLEGPATTSARRFQKGGKTRTIATNWLIWALYFLGVSPHRLARLYRSVR